MLRGARPASVTTLAIIGIIWASISTLGSCISFTALANLKDNKDPANAVFMADSVYKSNQIFSAVATAVLTIVLWFGSIGSFSLSPWARKAMLIWAWSYLVLIVIGAAVLFGYVVPFLLDKAVAAIAAAPPQPGGPPSAQVAEIVRMMFVVMGPIIFILLAVFPTFVLIFFNKKKVVDAFNGIFQNPPGYGNIQPQYYPPQPPQSPYQGPYR